MKRYFRNSMWIGPDMMFILIISMRQRLNKNSYFFMAKNTSIFIDMFMCSKWYTPAGPYLIQYEPKTNVVFRIFVEKFC